MISSIVAEIRMHLGRPMLHVDGKPVGFSCYSSLSPSFGDMFTRGLDRFAKHQTQVYMLQIPGRAWEDGDPQYDYFATSFWDGDRIDAEMVAPVKHSIDSTGREILARDPDALILIRSIGNEPASWRRLHPGELVVDEEGKRWECPSLASRRFTSDLGRAAAAICRHVEGLAWAAQHCIGYWVGHRFEGTHEPLMEHLAFDHGPLMVQAWRDFLRERYRTDEALRCAHGDPKVSLATIRVPRDILRGRTVEFERVNWVQAGPVQQARRDYLELQGRLMHERTATLATIVQDELFILGRQRIHVADTGKVMMQGWCNPPFFDRNTPWPLTPFDNQTGSGQIGVSGWLKLPGLDGIITPLDYQWRGLGGVTECEAAADSVVANGRIMLGELDQRTSSGRDPIATARTPAEFAALTWRAFASGLARGYHPYLMDLYEDWFTDEFHPTIKRQQDVMTESAAWPREDLPGIAMIVDDSAILDTNGNGAPLDELISWEWKQGLPRSGALYRTYTLDDLALPNLPRHRVWYFPALLRVDATRLELIRRVCCRDGATVVWGPCSGLSDGVSVDPAHATALTGFSFIQDAVNMPRRCLVSGFDHPITREVPADTWFGGAVSFGPAIYPTDGTPLAACWQKLGRNHPGLAVKAMDGWTSVFTAAGPLPAVVWRGIAKHAGAHVYHDGGEVLIAGRHLVALHSLRPGPKLLTLPESVTVIDVVSGATLGRNQREISWDSTGPETRVFRLIPE